MMKRNEIVAPTFRQDIHCMQMLQKKLQDSTDMTRFLPHFRVEKLRQENFHSNFVLRTVASDIAEYLRILRGNDIFIRKPEGI